MKIIFIFIGLIVCCLISCSSKRDEQYTLVSDRPWPIGEARTCSLDGKWKEGHCFPPANLSEPKYKYLVNVTLDKAIRFDSDQWAGVKGDVVCRLDSFERATCVMQKQNSD
jgi:hypothetical protein